MPDRIEIRPPKLAKIAKLLALEAFLIPASLYCALQRDDILLEGVGVFGLLFFGLGGLLATYSMLRRRWSLAISETGIEINTNGLPWTRVRRIDWGAVEAVGVADVAGQKMVGVRLSSPDAYLTRGETGAAGKARRRLLQTNRNLCGYDVAFAWSDLDRSPRDMVDLMMRYRRDATPGSSM